MRGASRSSRVLGAGCGGRAWRTRRMRLSRTAKSCGPDISTLISSRWDKPAGDGGKKARSPGRPRRKPLKPSAQGRPARSGEPVVDLLVCFFTFAREAAGASDARLSLRPLLLGAALAKLGRMTPRECGRSSAKTSSFRGDASVADPRCAIGESRMVRCEECTRTSPRPASGERSPRICAAGAVKRVAMAFWS
jgi:hypothetical protein